MGPEQAQPAAPVGAGPRGFRPGMQMGTMQMEALMQALRPLLEMSRRLLDEGMPPERAVRDAMMAGYLVGRGMDPMSALAMVRQWPAPQPAPGARPGLPRAQLIRDIQRFMLDQATAAAFYRRLAERATDPRVRDYIEHAAEDEQKHYRMLRSLYRELTGRTYDVQPEEVTFRTLAEGLEQAMDDEYEAMEEYRDVYLQSTEPAIRDLFFELMTDELEHATRFNYALQVIAGPGGQMAQGAPPGP